MKTFLKEFLKPNKKFKKSVSEKNSCYLEFIKAIFKGIFEVKYKIQKNYI